MERLKEWPTSPAFWFVFGLLGFPFLCFCGQLMMWALLLQTMPLRPSPPGGWGGGSGVWFGPMLGIFAAMVADEWKSGARLRARRVAALGGILVGAAWGWHLLHCDPFVWLGDFGCAVPPLAWAGGLLGFAILARHTEAK